MPAVKPSISIDPELYAAVRSAADADGVSFSAWLEEAARSRLRRAGLEAAIASYETEHGQIGDTTMAQARTELGLRRRSTRRRQG
jgi:hypothetical protein